jgi:pre-mRNA-splicing factor ISY1
VAAAPNEKVGVLVGTAADDPAGGAPKLGAAGLPNPPKEVVGGATAGVVLPAAACVALLGVPKPPNEGLETGVVEPLAEFAAPNRPPLEGAAGVVAPVKLNVGVLLDVPAPVVCPCPAPPKLKEEEAGPPEAGCVVLLVAPVPAGVAPPNEKAGLLFWPVLLLAAFPNENEFPEAPKAKQLRVSHLNVLNAYKERLTHPGRYLSLEGDGARCRPPSKSVLLLERTRSSILSNAHWPSHVNSNLLSISLPRSLSVHDNLPHCIHTQAMARNQEKAQSTLYRFRQAQAAELGISPQHTKRPRVTNHVNNLREAEKWRGEVLREISRKVSKIQDFGLTDYEVRDLNDEINKLIREKGAWEHQIVALGGANYKRGVPTMIDDAGREVPGTRGYKYFGRAKDLPGVKELLNRTAEQEAELESFRSLKYKRFAGQPPSYYGDEDEDDGVLLKAETMAESEEWEQRHREVVELLHEGSSVEILQIPPIPRPEPQGLKAIAAMQTDVKMNDGSVQAAGDANRVAAMFSVLDAEQLKMPDVPDRAKMEAIILQARKKALREQYIDR